MSLDTPGRVLLDEESSLDRSHELLVVQRTLFAGLTPEATRDLYCVAERGVIVAERDRLVVDGHAHASTNTYFGRFPASYWQRWTSVTAVTLDALVTGSGTLRLMASDDEGVARTVAREVVTDADARPVQLVADLDRFVDGGSLWLDVETDEAPLTVEAARWSVPPVRPRRATAVIICTYNRVDDCINTLQTLCADPVVASQLMSVYVVDQGSDPVESHPEFGAVRDQLSSTLRYIRQPNLGGAGGFTRGIYEAVRNETADRVNLLLMDDDIRLEPDTVLRLRGFADRTDEPTIVGGQMLNLLHPQRLHVGAETAVLDILRAGRPVDGALANADVTEEEQNLRVDAAYNAWWTCLIPSEVVSEIGYPLPLFFQWDDIEYGLRAGAAGFPTVTLPGAGVWHADFSWKNWDDWSRYFSFRNSLIASALHGGFDRRRLVDHLARQLLDALVSMRYGLATLTITAIEDFLEGPEGLRDGGGQTAAAVRKLWAAHPETRNHPAHDVPGVSRTARPRTAPAGRPSMMRAVLAKRIVWQLLGKVSGTAGIASSDAHWWHVSRFETAVVTDDSQEGVRVRRFDRDQMLALARRGGLALWRLNREGEAVRQRYRDALPELSSRGTWERIFTSR